MLLFEKINKDLLEAMKSKDKIRLEALRGAKKALLEAKTAVSSSHELSDEETIKILSKLAKQGRESASIYEQQSRPELATEELNQVAVFETYLPAMLTEDELRTAVQQIIAETGASSMKEMGKVMGLASKQLTGKADGKAISEMVKALLS